MFCRNCGKEITGTKNFCPHCGTPLKKVPTETETKNTNVPKKEEKPFMNLEDNQKERRIRDEKNGDNKKIILAIGGAAVALVVCVAIFIGMGGLKGAKKAVQQGVPASTHEVGVPLPEEESSDGNDIENSAEVVSMPYTDNDSMNFSACLSPDAYEEIVSDDGELQFAYPKYLFNGSECNRETNDYKFYYTNGLEYETYLHYYEEDQTGDVLNNLQSLYKRFSGILSENYFERVSEEVDSKGMGRVLLGGYTDAANRQGVYIIAANNGRKNYIMEFYYPDSNFQNLYKEENYVTDCLYRFCSYAGGTYKPRTYQQFLNDEWGEKK